MLLILFSLVSLVHATDKCHETLNPKDLEVGFTYGVFQDKTLIQLGHLKDFSVSGTSTVTFKKKIVDFDLQFLSRSSCDSSSSCGSPYCPDTSIGRVCREASGSHRCANGVPMRNCTTISMEHSLPFFLYDIHDGKITVGKLYDVNRNRTVEGSCNSATCTFDLGVASLRLSFISARQNKSILAGSPGPYNEEYVCDNVHLYSRGSSSFSKPFSDQLLGASIREILDTDAVFDTLAYNSKTNQVERTIEQDRLRKLAQTKCFLYSPLLNRTMKTTADFMTSLSHLGVEWSMIGDKAVGYKNITTTCGPAKTPCDLEFEFSSCSNVPLKLFYLNSQLRVFSGHENIVDLWRVGFLLQNRDSLNCSILQVKDNKFYINLDASEWRIGDLSTRNESSLSMVSSSFCSDYESDVVAPLKLTTGDFLRHITFISSAEGVATLLIKAYVEKNFTVECFLSYQQIRSRTLLQNGTNKVSIKTGAYSLQIYDNITYSCAKLPERIMTVYPSQRKWVTRSFRTAPLLLVLISSLLFFTVVCCFFTLLCFCLKRRKQKRTFDYLPEEK